MSDHPITANPLVASMIASLAAAIPGRGRWTFTELLVGAAVTLSGPITDAIVTAGHPRSWITYFWFVEPARWSWLALWAALLGALKQRFSPAVWHVILDDTVGSSGSRPKPPSVGVTSITPPNPTVPASSTARAGSFASSHRRIFGFSPEQGIYPILEDGTLARRRRGCQSLIPYRPTVLTHRELAGFFQSHGGDFMLDDAAKQAYPRKLEDGSGASLPSTTSLESMKPRPCNTSMEPDSRRLASVESAVGLSDWDARPDAPPGFALKL